MLRAINPHPPDRAPSFLPPLPYPPPALDIQVKGLLGGHSGINIHEDRGELGFGGRGRGWWCGGGAELGAWGAPAGVVACK